MAGKQTAVRVTAKKAFEVVEVPIPEPRAREVRVKVEACGICHSDVLVKEALWPGLALPRIPGHEVVGVVDAVGSEVAGFSPGDRVGVGWNAGHCFTCDPCRAGDFTLCENGLVCGISYDGGYQQYAVFPREALARVPDGLTPAEAAPLLCAGVTTYNALRNSGARPGDTVAVLGVGGLGHLGIQYAHHLGYRTVAVSGSAAKEEFARELGADDYVDASAGSPAEALAAMGGARVILATAPDSETMTAAVDGLGRNGVLLIVGVAEEPIRVSPLQLVGRRASVTGWPSGHAKDSEETLEFSARRGIRPLVETFPLTEAPVAFARMMANEVRFRAVLLPF
jgi:D-arabinose 1-dehydrogenase-like Zn-dependent alcohol dehydrogenase